MKVNSGLIMISVSVPAGKAFHLLYLAIEAFGQGIGYLVSGIGYDIIDMRFQTLRGLDDWGQPGVCSPEVPAREVFPHPTFFMIVP